MVSFKCLAAILRLAWPASVFFWHSASSFISIAACLLSEHNHRHLYTHPSFHHSRLFKVYGISGSPDRPLIKRINKIKLIKQFHKAKNTFLWEWCCINKLIIYHFSHVHIRGISPKFDSEINNSQFCMPNRAALNKNKKKHCVGKRCLLSILPEMLHLELQVLAEFPLLLQPCRCLLGLKNLEDPLLLLHLLPERGEPAKLHLHLTQLQSEERGCRKRWMSTWTLSTSAVIHCSRCKTYIWL